MPHGTAMVGNVEVIALCDGVVEASDPIEEHYPTVPPSAWDDLRRRYPETVSPEGGWRLHVHAYVLSSAGRTVLVDTGIGPETAPAFSWSSTRGRLGEELAAAGVDPAAVDDVVITHVHDDHLGWNVAEGTREPLFANARYVVHRADWELMRTSEEPEDLVIFPAVLRPLEDAGVLLLSEGRLELTDEFAVVHAPGHTPGHQVVLVDSGDARAIVSGDTVNHPLQVIDPSWYGTSDFEPERAAVTRREWLDRIEREGRLMGTSHFAEPFGQVATDGGRRLWRPLPVDEGLTSMI